MAGPGGFFYSPAVSSQAKDNTAATDAIDKALQSIIDDGTYTKILQAWDVTTGAVSQATINGG